MKPQSFRIEVFNTDDRFDCKADEFVLEAMKRSGRGPIRCGCFGGGCGVCKMKIVSGDFFAEKRMSRAHVSKEEQMNGIVLLCCVKPRGDLTIARLEDERISR